MDYVILKFYCVVLDFDLGEVKKMIMRCKVGVGIVECCDEIMVFVCGCCKFKIVSCVLFFDVW